MLLIELLRAGAGVVLTVASGPRVGGNITIFPNDTVFYCDFWLSHWCQYYNDRGRFQAPHLNWILHLARSRGFQVMFIHAHGATGNADSGIRSASRALEHTWKNASIGRDMPYKWDFDVWAKGFRDGCGYGADRKKEIRQPNPLIAVGPRDLVAVSFPSAARLAKLSGARNMVMMGVHSNICMRRVAMFLIRLGITPIWPLGLYESAYFYEGQRAFGVRTHSLMNARATERLVTYDGVGVEGDDVFAALEREPPLQAWPQWTLYPGAARAFRRMYL